MARAKKITEGVRLLSALRKIGSSSALAELPDTYFTEKAELDAFHWLKEYVRQYRQFPTPEVFKRETGVQTVITKEPYEYYLGRARNRVLFGKLTTHLEKFQDAMEDKDPETAVTIAKQIIADDARIVVNNKDDSSLSSVIPLVLSDYEEAHRNPGLRGITSGWPRLDLSTGGWQNSDLITFVGRPGIGKTYILLNQAFAAWKAGHSVFFISMEMGALQLARRALGLYAKVNPDFIRKGMLSTDIKRTLEGAATRMIHNEVPFNLSVGSFRKSVPAIRAKCEEILPDIIFVDASYLLTPEKKRAGSSSRRESVSDVIEELKMIGTDIDRPIIQSVQFNRHAERTPTNRPRNDANNTVENDPLVHLNLSKIGETDVVGQASSVVIGMEKPDDETRMIRHMKFLKGREGESGRWDIHYNFKTMNFSEIRNSSEERSPEQAEYNRRYLTTNPDAAGESVDLDWNG
jgi:replicative DNA helicase